MPTITKVAIIGNPYNVGWEGPGIDEAVAGFREAGLVERLKQVVPEVVDLGDVEVDLPPYDVSDEKFRNPAQVAAVSVALAEDRNSLSICLAIRRFCRKRTW